MPFWKSNFNYVWATRSQSSHQVLINFQFFGELMIFIFLNRNIFDSDTIFSIRVIENIFELMKKSAKNSSYLRSYYIHIVTIYNFLNSIITIQIAIMVIFIKLYCGNPEIRKFSQRANCAVQKKIWQKFSVWKKWSFS